MSRKLTKMQSKKFMEAKSTTTVPETKPQASERTIAPTLGKQSGMKVGSLLQTWAEVSKINYLAASPYDVIANESMRLRTIGKTGKETQQSFLPSLSQKFSNEDEFDEQIPVNITPLMNDDQLWGCFYTFPELYADMYSPTVRIRNLEDVPELIGGVLTRDMVTACLTYLKRTPILGDFVYIKLDLSAKHLINIDVLQRYKYLVYLDLSSNLLTELTVLTHLPYLQFLSVAFNRLNTVLEYDTPQWFLTEVHYKFNSVKKINDLRAFWSITILDLSHNNIKSISGLESLRYLRRLDLSFNHIQRLENLNNLRLLWLDVSYNNVSSFEISATSGLWTLLHLEYLNLNENNLTSLKIFSRCTRLRELHARNNRFSMLLELAVYMRQMRRLVVVDLRANPVCSTPGYKEVVVNTFPLLLSLDAEELNPIFQRSLKMNMKPDIHTFATRRLVRLLYIEQLSRNRVSPYIPPADTTEIPLVILVGQEAVGKGALARRLAEQCSNNVELGYLHTTASYRFLGHYKEVSRNKFDDMLLAGEFLSYSEMDGESYGLSREDASVNEGKVKIVCLDLISALMLVLRGLRPYLILVTLLDKKLLATKQQERKSFRKIANEQRMSLETPKERSKLQILLSERIIITGIINEILLSLPEVTEKSEFVMESDCSLIMDSEARKAVADYAQGRNLINLPGSSTTSLEKTCKRTHEACHMDPSVHSLYKGSQVTDEYNSYANGQNSFQDRNAKQGESEWVSRTKQEKPASISRPKSVDFSRYASSTWKVPNSSKSSKSVTFTAEDAAELEAHLDPAGMLIEPPSSTDKEKAGRSISTKIPWKARGRHTNSTGSRDDLDLWLAFLTETGLLQSSSINCQQSMHADIMTSHDTHLDDPESIIRHLTDYQKDPHDTVTTNIGEEYEDIHRKYPGTFMNTIGMDNADNGFNKLKHIVQNIVKSQSNLKPMMDIDFANLPNYPTVQIRLDSICNQIAPQRLFY